MSLINDALRRAKQVQQDAPSPPVAPAPHFRPVEPLPQTARHGLGLMLPVSLVTIALLSLLLFWVMTKRDGSSASGESKTPLSVAARTVPSSNGTFDHTALRPSAADPGAVSSGGGNTSDKAATVQVGAPAPTPQAALAPGSTNSAAVSDSGDTNHAPVAPPPLKLQSIVFNPKRPSAMINGRVVFIGEKVRDYRVIAIQRDNVVLAGAGQTNLLSLDP